MASDGVENTPSAAILWTIYTDRHGFATRGDLLESGQFTKALVYFPLALNYGVVSFYTFNFSTVVQIRG